MARRRHFLEVLISAATRLPRWLAAVLAVASFVILSYPAALPLPAATELRDLAALTPGQYLIVLARLAQFLVPALFILGIVLSVARGGSSAGGGAREAAARAQEPHSPDLSSLELTVIVEALYRSQGYRVVATSEQPDGGIDFILERNGGRFVVRCKHWHSRPVDVSAVADMPAAMAAAAAAGGAVLTTGEFSAAAAELARRTGVQMIDRNTLQNLHND
jgi:restriction system protein